MPEVLNVLLVDQDAEHRSQLERMLAAAAMTVIGSAERGIDAAHQAATLRPDVVLVHIEEPLDIWSHTLEAVQFAQPSAALVAVSHSDGLATVQAVMLAGARGFLVTPTTAEALRRTLLSAHERHGEFVRRAASGGQMDPTVVAGQVITLFSPKGGVGRTTLAVNLAIGIAQQSGARVVLVDADAHFGDVAITMGIEADVSLPDLVEAMGEREDVDLEAYLAAHSSGARVLAAKETGSLLRDIDPDTLAEVIRRLAATFDYVVVDTSGSFDPHVAASLDESTMALLVTSADVASLKDARMGLKLLAEGGFDVNRVRLVVNHATRVEPVSDADVAATVGQPVFWTFRHDSNVPKSTQRGEPIVMARPRARLTRDVNALAVHIAGDGAQPARRWGFDLFRR